MVFHKCISSTYFCTSLAIFSHECTRNFAFAWYRLRVFCNKCFVARWCPKSGYFCCSECFEGLHCKVFSQFIIFKESRGVVYLHRKWVGGIILSQLQQIFCEQLVSGVVKVGCAIGVNIRLSKHCCHKLTVVRWILCNPFPVWQPRHAQLSFCRCDLHHVSYLCIW